MRFHALAADYDGTLAQEGVVDDPTMRALERFAATGRKLVLVTGRELDQLQTVFPGLGIFDQVVAENGALLYTPKTGVERLLAVPPPARFAEELRRRGVSPLSVGRVIVATLHPHEATVLEVIRELGLELHVIFNKGSVMILPVTVSKATGLAFALEELALSRHNVVAVGDAENDHALLQSVEYGVAVANALPTLKQSADRTTRFPRGAGVTELIDDVITTDLAHEVGRLTRHRLALGKTAAGEDVSITPSGLRLVVTASNARDSRRITSALFESAVAAGYQLCVIHGSSEYVSMQGAVILGTPDRAPSLAELASALALPKTSVVVCVAAIVATERPAFVQEALARARSSSQHAGHPQFVLLDQIEQLVDLAGADAHAFASRDLANVVVTTSRPESLPPALVRHATTMVAIGEREHTHAALDALGRAADLTLVSADANSEGHDASGALFWSHPAAPVAFTPR